MSDITIKSVVNKPDGSLFHRQENEWPNLSPEQEQMLFETLQKQERYLNDLKANQKKTPDAVFSATLSCTGVPDIHYEAFTFDSYQKAFQAWNKAGDELLRMIEKGLKGRGQP